MPGFRPGPFSQTWTARRTYRSNNIPTPEWFVHQRAEGSDKGDQILSLLYTFDRDANGTPFIGVIGARMHFQDPYAPEDRMQLDLSNERQLLNQTAHLSCTAAWPDYPWNKIVISLVAPTG